MIVETTMHPTKRRLIEVTHKIYEEQPIHTITSELVLKLSGITKGSLYHHFADFPDLIESVQVVRYEKFASLELSEMTIEINGDSDIETARSRLFSALRKRQDSTTSSDRAERTWIIAQALMNARLATKIISSEERITELWMNLYSSCADRGWTNSSLDAQSVSVVTQAAIFSRVFSDLRSEELATENWITVVEAMVDRLYFSNRVVV